MCSTEEEEEEGAILLAQTEPTPSELLAMADGGRNERQMEKFTSNMFIIDKKRVVCVCDGG